MSAETRCPQTSIGRRRTRSTHTPSAGAKSEAASMKKKVMPAAAFDPVSVFTQMLRTRSMTESPKEDTVMPTKSRVKPG